MHWYGREVPYHVMVLDRLNLTVEEAISKCHDINSVFLYADQMLSCLKSLHEQSYIHRDVKPANFMTGIGELSQYTYVVVTYLGRTSSRDTPLRSMEHPFLR
ncbi:hypothetical protein H4582DRAFT_2061729 [Lactarius indigo]|nr:hypothetical protein H4582DRAFT_2061729 [Lactarius indigo]